MLLFGVLVKIHSQDVTLKIKINDTLQQKLLDTLHYKRIHNNQQEALNEINLIAKQFYNKGFVNHQYHIQKNDSIVTANFNLGIRISTVRIYTTNTFSINFLKKFNTTLFDNFIYIPIQDLEIFLNAAATEFEKQGFSFTEVSLKNIKKENEQLIADLNIHKTNKRTIQKIVFKGYTEFPKKYIKNYFNIHPNTIFNIQKLTTLNKQLNKLPFISNIKAPEVLFLSDSTVVYCYVQKKALSKFQGIIGFASKENTNKVAFTGNIDLHLSNVFNKGEEISLNWKSNSNDTKLFKTRFFTPYIYNTKISPEIIFTIYKQDTTYTQTTSHLNLNYILNKKHALNLKLKQENSLLTTNEPLNNFQDFKKTTFGGSYEFTSIGNTATYHIALGYLNGFRKSSQVKKQQQLIEIFGDVNFTISPKSTMILKQQSELLISNQVFENEFYKIGGSSSIRGFDEFSIKASKYSITNLEFHYHLTQASSIYSISDIGYVKTSTTLPTSKLYTLGIGYQFSTEKSSTNLSYAIGKTNNQPFRFNRSKIHLTVSYFF